MDISPFDRMEFYQLLCKYQDSFEGEPAEALAQRLVPLRCCRGEILHIHQHSLLDCNKTKSLASATPEGPVVPVPNDEDDVGVYGALVGP
jgi:hypothetical protein